MQIKIFRAQTMKDVLAQIRAELGPEAVILANREIKDAGAGKPQIEVTAAVDFDQDQVATPAPAAAPANLSGDTARLENEIATLKDMMQALLKHSGVETQPCRLGENLVNLGLRRSLAEILIRKLGAGASLAELRGLLTQLVKTEPAPCRLLGVLCHLRTIRLCRPSVASGGAPPRGSPPCGCRRWPGA